MKQRDREIAQAVAADLEAESIPNLKPLRSGMRDSPRHQLTDAAAILVKAPCDPAVTELYLQSLIGATRRQVGGQLCIGPTFGVGVQSIKRKVSEALPRHTRRALTALARMAIDDPVRAEDIKALAHGMARNGALVAWLAEHNDDHYAVLGITSDATDHEVKQAYRRQAQANHPDRNPDDPDAAERFHRIQRAYTAIVGKPTSEDRSGETAEANDIDSRESRAVQA